MDDLRARSTRGTRHAASGAAPTAARAVTTQTVMAPSAAELTVAAYFDITPVPNGDGGDS